MSRFFVVLIALSALAVGSASALTNEFLDRILEAESLTWGETALLVLTGARIVGDDASIEDALATRELQDWNLGRYSVESPVTLGAYAYLLMQAFRLDGGLMYRIAPGPRYAFRELRYRAFIERPAAPFWTVSGERALRILSRVLDSEGASR